MNQCPIQQCFVLCITASIKSCIVLPALQSYFSDGFFAGATDQQYTDFVNMVKAMGFNLLRVHGKVEDPQLYHAANTLGLVIMQASPRIPTFTGSR